MIVTWRLGAVASALLFVGAVSAQSGPQDRPDPGAAPDPQAIALSMPTPALPSVPSSSPADAAHARAAIEKANAQWLSAFRQNDPASLARIYTPDASLFPPSNVGLEGRDRIVEYFQAQRKAGMGDASLKTLDVVCVGDVAYEVGTYGFHFDGSSNASGDTGRYFAIWKGSPDGSWRYQVGIWSSNRDAGIDRR